MDRWPAVRTLLSLALGLAAGPLSAQTRPSQAIVLRAARMIDGTGAAPIMPAMVRIEGARIAEVGTKLRIPPGARLVDLGDATLLPGLIDLHTHLTGDERVHWEDALVRSTPPADALWGARNARITLLAGFTSVRDLGPTWPYVDVELRRAIDDDAVPGPRMMVAGNYVSSTGGAGDARQFSIYVDVPVVRNLADGADEVTKAVRTHLKNGADFIKILATGAILSKGIAPGAQQYADEELRAAVVEARRWGTWVASHAHGADGIKASIRAGVRTVDHGSYLDDEAVGPTSGPISSPRASSRTWRNWAGRSLLPWPRQPPEKCGLISKPRSSITTKRLRATRRKRPTSEPKRSGMRRNTTRSTSGTINLIFPTRPSPSPWECWR